MHEEDNKLINTVVISADEYRELVIKSAVAEVKLELETTKNNYWNLYSERVKLEKDNKKLVKDIDLYVKFIRENGLSEAFDKFASGNDKGE